MLSRPVALGTGLILVACYGRPQTEAVQCPASIPADFDAAIESAFASHPNTPGIVVGIHRPDIGFAVAAPSHGATGGSFGEGCGSALSPLLQNSGEGGPCNEALLGLRVVAGTLASLAAIGAFLGIRYSRSVGRTHNHERDMCLVVACVAVFLLAWVVLAYLTARAVTYEAS